MKLVLRQRGLRWWEEAEDKSRGRIRMTDTMQEEMGTRITIDLWGLAIKAITTMAAIRAIRPFAQPIDTSKVQ